MKQTLTSAEAKALGYMSIADALKLGLTSKHRTTLNREAKNGTLPSCWVGKGSRAVLWVLKESLNKTLPDRSVNSYDRLEKLWISEMRNGNFGGKPYSENTIRMREWSLGKYWELLEKPKSITELNIGNFRYVLTCFKHDIENHNDHYGLKMQVYSAVTGFMKFLVNEGLKSKEDREAILKFRPKRRYSPKKKVVEDYEIIDAIKYNREWRTSRSEYDIAVLDVILHLYAYAGIRREEAIELKREHIYFKDRLIKVFGKNSKERFVTPHPNIWPTLEDWLKNYCSNAPTGLLLHNSRGRKFTNRVINRRFENLTRKMGKTIQPHALRRGFAVLMANLGMPLNQLQMIMGHEDIKVTMGYVMTTYKHAQQWVSQNLAPPEPITHQETIQDDDDLLLEYLKG